MSLDTTGTILTMSVVGGSDLLPFYSARGLRQTMKPIGAANVQEDTVNGETVDLSVARFHKYASRISAKTVRPPAFDRVFPGTVVDVVCAFLLSYATIGGSPALPVASGTSFVEGNWTFYQPLVRFMIGDLSNGFDEWEADNDWFIDLKQVRAGA